MDKRSKLWSLAAGHAAMIVYAGDSLEDEEILGEALELAVSWVVIQFEQIKEVMEPMLKTSADNTEAAAKEAFAKVQDNQHYEFEMSELAGHISSGILEIIYKQAFFAGYNYRRSLEVMESENRKG